MRGSRPLLLAALLAAGIAVGGAAGPLAAAPLPWLAAAALAAALATGPRSPGGRAAAVTAAVILFGVGRGAAVRRSARRVLAIPGAVPDDRGRDRIAGVVAGPVEETGWGWRFLLRADAPGRPGVEVSVSGWRAPPRPVSASLLPGDRVQIVGRLMSPRGYRDPGAADARALAAARGASWLLWSRARDVAVIARDARITGWRWAAEIQRWMSARIAARGGDRRGVGIVRAMVAGDRAGIDGPLARVLRNAGIAHMLAVSGLHLAAVALLAFAAARRLAAAVTQVAARCDPARVGALVAAPAAIAYTLVTGAHLSTLRALVVVLFVLAGAALRRRAAALDALGTAALLILIADPHALLEASFQLSFAAAITLALVGRRPVPHGPRRADAGAGRCARVARAAGRALWRVAAGARELVRASVWVFAATAPIAALAFAAVPTGGIVANLFAVPASELAIVPLGLAGTALSAISVRAGGALLDCAVWTAARVADGAACIAARAPVVQVPPPGRIELALAAVAWAAAMCWARRIRRRWAAVAAAAALVALAGCYGYREVIAPARSRALRVTFVDVGQGDAAVLELPGGAVWLVDTGGRPFVRGRGLSPAERSRRAASPARRALVPLLLARRIHRIDRVILSHPHPDHYGGLAALIGRFDIGEVWAARPHIDQPPSTAYTALLVELAARGTRIVYPPLGLADHDHGVELWVLGPRYVGSRAAADPVFTVNDNSLVVRVDYAGRRILFSGDLEQEGESLLVERNRRALAADIVKVPHHGSGTSSSPAFVAATGARVAVISCGVANRFRFPAPAVVARWRREGARVLRTDRRGAVTAVIEPDGAMRVRTFDPPPRRARVSAAVPAR